MDAETDFYICPTCFQVCETEKECHQHIMIACHPGEVGGERRKPVLNKQGIMVSRAPRWYLEAIGWLPVE